jgi:hypothetical protein
MPAKVNRNYRKLRAQLIARGTNLRRWATDHGYPVTTVYDAARGTRAGIRCVQIRRELEEFAYAK